MRRVETFLLLLALGLVSGCAPAEIGGDYMVSLTYGDNGCAFDAWTVGETASGVPVVVTQSGDQAQLDVGGSRGVGFDILLGSSLFEGQVAGNNVTAALVGSRSWSEGMCTYTITVDLDASVDGDFIEGRLTYRPVTNMHADCAMIEGCESMQSFNGTRPPSP